MKTTVELPDALVIEAKKRAAELRQPLRVLIENGLRAELLSLRRPRVEGARMKLHEGLRSADRIDWTGQPGDADLDPGQPIREGAGARSG